MSMTKLTSWNGRTNRVKMAEEPCKLDVKDPIQGAVMAKIITDIRRGDYEDMANLQEVAGGFATREAAQPVVIGRESVTTLSNGKKTAETSDPAMVKTLEESGWTIDGCKIVDILG